MGAAGSVIDDGDDSPVASSKALAATSPLAKSQNVRSNTGENDSPTFLVSLGFWPATLPKLSLPSQFKLKISFESLDFVRIDDGTPIIQFPFQNIICWGSSINNFQFKVFNIEKNADGQKENGSLISLRTYEGKEIEDATMDMVQKLMVDINQRAISKLEFSILLDSIFEDGNETQLKEDWMTIIDQFTSTGRHFLAKQGMELLFKVGPVAPFEKFDLACLLYERIINKNSFQLLINTFEDEHDRENLVHRLQLNKKGKDVVTNCTILPEA